MTIRELASLAGVSKTTVAYGLKNDPRVSPSTRAQIQALAQKHGYSPSPVVNSFMQEVRAGSVKQRRYSLAYLCGRGVDKKTPIYDHEREFVHGAREEAHALGYDLDLLEWKPGVENARQLERVLLARGLKGVIVGPARNAHEHLNLDWQKFAVLCSGYSVENPRADRVAADLFKAFNEMVDLALSRGYEPVVAVMDPNTDQRLGQRWLSAISLQQRVLGSSMVKVCRGKIEDVFPLLKKLIKSGKVPAVFGQGNSIYALREQNFKVPQQVGMVAFDKAGVPKELSAIDQPHELLGRRAVAHLSALIERGQWGLPDAPCRLTIECGWREGKTMPPRK